MYSELHKVTITSTSQFQLYKVLITSTSQSHLHPHEMHTSKHIKAAKASVHSPKLTTYCVLPCDIKRQSIIKKFALRI